MLGTVTGVNLGVARNINPIIVRIGAGHPGSAYSPWEWLGGLAQVNLDLGTANTEITTAIVLLATEIPRSEIKENGVVVDATFFQTRAAALLNAMIAKGALPITGSGNQQAITIDAWPQNFGKPSGVLYIPQLMVMGSVNPAGTVRAGKQVPIVASGLSYETSIFQFGPVRHVLRHSLSMTNTTQKVRQILTVFPKPTHQATALPQPTEMHRLGPAMDSTRRPTAHLRVSPSFTI